jgi:hypothetical protein
LEREIPKRGANFKYGGPNKPFVVVSGGGRLIYWSAKPFRFCTWTEVGSGIK